MTEQGGSTPAAGWYPDPEHSGQQRYWDGAAWTEHRSPGLEVRSGPQRDPGDVWKTPELERASNGLPGWAWVLIVVTVLIVAGMIVTLVNAAMGDNSDGSNADRAPAATPAAPQEPETDAVVLEIPPGGFGPGVWLVGEDIEPGTYRTVGPLEGDHLYVGCYYSHHADTSGDFDSYIESAYLVGGIATVALEDGHEFTSSDCGAWAPVDPDDLFQNADVATVIEPGAWLVGEDIAPGTYRTDAVLSFDDGYSYCDYTHESRYSGGYDALIITGLTPGGRPTVTLEIGHQFTSSDCGTWVQVDPDGLFQNADAATTFGTGMWLVGEDIAPGVYRTDEAVDTDSDGYEFCFWSRQVGIEKSYSEYVASDLVDAGRPTVTLEVGEMFDSDDCGTWTRSE